MPVTQPMSLKDFFKTIGTAFDPTKAPGARTQTLPNGGGSFKTPTVAPASYGSSDFVSGPIGIRSIYGDNGQADFAGPQNTPPAPAPAGGGTRTFQGGKTTTTPPVVPPADTTAPETLDYSQYQDRINPDTGKLFTPQEYADHIAQRANGGTIPQYAGDSITKGPQTAEDLAGTARDLNNSRNDIATGEKDPYEAASESGIQYTPTELKAIESAYAGVYDPALNDVFKKLDLRKKQDDAAAAQKIAAAKTQTDFENDLKKMDIQFKYNLALERDKAAHDGSNLDLSGLSLGDYATTTSSGNKYIDLSTVTDKKEKHVVENAARASGVPVLTDTNVQKMNAIEDTRNNLENIKAQFDKIGYSSGGTKALGGLGFGASNRIADFFGDTNVGSFKAWRTAAINSIQALAGGTGSGLRINQAEINAAMENDIPNIADTVAVGDAKLGVLRKQLDSWENTLLQGNTGKNINKDNTAASSSVVTAPDGTKVEIVD